MVPYDLSDYNAPIETSEDQTRQLNAALDELHQVIGSALAPEDVENYDEGGYE
ncbi:MAG TPA: hypothetical protein VI072_16255 [Polyangiaceae bacterium]